VCFGRFGQVWEVVAALVCVIGRTASRQTIIDFWEQRVSGGSKVRQISMFVLRSSRCLSCLKFYCQVLQVKFGLFGPNLEHLHLEIMDMYLILIEEFFRHAFESYVPFVLCKGGIITNESTNIQKLNRTFSTKLVYTRSKKRTTTDQTQMHRTWISLTMPLSSPTC
jgi:hypothetical protein